ncbi:phosphoadenylyl-sulfate reductase [Buchnera aphidicola]
MKKFNNLNLKKKNELLYLTNIKLQKMSISNRILWAIENLPHNHIMSSSFGIQSLVSLHLINKYYKDIPVIFIDTGYLFKETYLFVDKVINKFKFNLKIFRSNLSPAWQEARYGKLWEQGISGLELYNQINKIDPMKEALKKLQAQTWFAGLRNQQSDLRASLSILNVQNNVFKFLPIIDWDDKMVQEYITENDLFVHPLYNKGYISVGDVHTTKPINKCMSEKETRFFGLKRECGLHECI